MGRNAWRAVEARYEQLREADGLPATFEVLLCTARKAI
jgi:malonyl-CoA O-methyltransferase